MIALFAFIILGVKSKLKFSKKTTAGWLGVGICFLYLAIDDAAQIHERIGSIVDSINASESKTKLSPSSLSPSYSWHIIFGPIFFLMGIGLISFFWSQYNTYKQRAGLITSFSCLGLAVLLDFFEGLSINHSLRFQESFSQYFNLNVYTTTHFLKVIEECLEMTAMAIFLLLIVNHSLEIAKNVSFKISN